MLSQFLNVHCFAQCRSAVAVRGSGSRIDARFKMDLGKPILALIDTSSENAVQSKPPFLLIGLN